MSKTHKSMVFGLAYQAVYGSNHSEKETNKANCTIAPTVSRKNFHALMQELDGLPKLRWKGTLQGQHW